MSDRPFVVSTYPPTITTRPATHPVGGEVTEYRNQGKELDRIDGPAVITRYTDGFVREEYRRNGVRHRIDGPAVLDYDPDGVVDTAWWYLEGERITDLREFAEILTNYEKRGRLHVEFVFSSYRPFIDEKIDPLVIVRMIAEDVWTVEGIREVLAGAPAEWVAAFEAGRA